MTTSQGPITILIVDANKVSRDTLSHYIRFKFPDVALHTTENYHMAVQFCELNSIDLIIMDTGACNDSYCQDTIKTLKSINCHTEFVVITSTSDERVLNSTAERLDISLIQMPVSLNELMTVTQGRIHKVAMRAGRCAGT